jgi:hypothetical protein
MDAGKGRMTIVESVPPERVVVKLEFEEPMASTATIALSVAETPTGALVTWAMDGKHNFVGKAFGLFVDMDAMHGADVDGGLAQLKSVAEGERVASEGK